MQNIVRLLLLLLVVVGSNDAEAGRFLKGLRGEPTLLWSEASTWADVNGGTVPCTGALANQPITIPATKNIIVDMNVDCGYVTNEGVIQFARQNITFQAYGVMNEEGATWKIGTAEQPFTQTAIIELDGPMETFNSVTKQPTGVASSTQTIDVSSGAPVVADNDSGGAMRGFHNHGTLEWYGTPPTKTWTKLANGSTATAGTTALTTQDTHGWTAGDEVVVDITTFHSNSSLEKFTLNAASGTSLTLPSGLAAARYTKLQYPCDAGTISETPCTFTTAGMRASATVPDVIDERPAVINLTRNIKFRGANDTAWTANFFGAHLMTMYPGVMKLDGVEFMRVGQENKLARYPFHWHMWSYVPSTGAYRGDATGQYVKNCSVHQSAFRMATIHGTRGVTVDNCVGYDIPGMAIFFEEGAAEDNTVTNNAILGVKAVPSTRTANIQTFDNPTTLANIQKEGPACIWLTNPKNTLTGNFCSRADGVGIWNAFSSQTFGLSLLAQDPTTGLTIVPQNRQITLHANNTAHSNLAPNMQTGTAQSTEAGGTALTEYRPQDYDDGFVARYTYVASGTTPIALNDTVTGNTSNATGKVTGITVTSGSWGAGTATGLIRITQPTGSGTGGTFQDGESLKVSGTVRATTVPGTKLTSSLVRPHFQTAKLWKGSYGAYFNQVQCPRYDGWTVSSNQGAGFFGVTQPCPTSRSENHLIVGTTNNSAAETATRQGVIPPKSGQASYHGQLNHVNNSYYNFPYSAAVSWEVSNGAVAGGGIQRNHDFYLIPNENAFYRSSGWKIANSALLGYRMQPDPTLTWTIAIHKDYWGYYGNGTDKWVIWDDPFYTTGAADLTAIQNSQGYTTSSKFYGMRSWDYDLTTGGSDGPQLNTEMTFTRVDAAGATVGTWHIKDGRWEGIHFNNGGAGGVAQPVPGDTLTGAISGGSSTVQAVKITSGSWGAGTAAGTIYVTSWTNTSASTFPENLQVGGTTRMTKSAAYRSRILGNMRHASAIQGGKYIVTHPLDAQPTGSYVFKVYGTDMFTSADKFTVGLPWGGANVEGYQHFGHSGSGSNYVPTGTRLSSNYGKEFSTRTTCSGTANCISTVEADATCNTIALDTAAKLAWVQVCGTLTFPADATYGAADTDPSLNREQHITLRPVGSTIGNSVGVE